MRELLPALACFVALSATAEAGEKELPELTRPMMLGDQAMDCQQIVSEVAMMERRLGGSPSGALMDGEHLANVGTSLAGHAALSAGAGGAALGAINGVGGLLGRSSKKKKEYEAAQRAIAEKRWLYMVGLYHGKSCDAQMAAAAEDPAPQPETE